MRDDLEVGDGATRRRIAVDVRPGASPPVVWLGGFRSDMTGTKAEALDGWAAETGRAFLRFDYTGHGASGGRFAEGTISLWLADALAVIGRHAPDAPVLIGSSMGGWIALLANRALRAASAGNGPSAGRGPSAGNGASALVLVAPAVDFTERLMWASFPDEVRARIMADGSVIRPSRYGEEGYPITRDLIEDGRSHLLLDGTIEPGCPVHILQGVLDEDVPWDHAVTLVEHLPADGVQLTLIPDGDHRLSRPADIGRLVAAVEAACRPAAPQLRLTV